MDNTVPNMGNNTHKKITTIVVMLLVLAALCFGAYLLKNMISEPQDEKNTSQSADGFPTIFYSYLGTVQAIDNNKITILALAEKNYLKADETIIVLTNEETVFLSQDKNFDIDQIKPGESGEFYKTKTITLGDLKVGDEITVIDNENVRGKTEFSAKRVEVTAR